MRTSTGRTCDGYEETALEQPSQSHSRIQAVTYGYSNSQEARSMQFFMERTLSQLTSFFPDEFWGITILQVAQSEPSISHALLSFSAYHEAYTNGVPGNNIPFALKHYNLSIQELRASHRSLSHVHLVSCLVFICIEILQGHTGTAVRLFKDGFRMMSQFYQLVDEQRSQATELSDIRDHMRTLFTRLALQVALLAERTSSALVVLFSKWSQALDRFIISRGKATFTPSEQKSLALIDLHRRYFNIVLPWENKHNQQYVLSLDRYTSEFEELVNCASRVLSLEETEPKSQAAPVFHLEIGAVPVLFMTVAWCRDPVIRRRAISLLMSNQAQEGIWSSLLTGRVARRLMEAEEGDLNVHSCKDVPGPRRVTSVLVRLGPREREATIRYGLHDREWEERIAW
ncbi:hypothetical protein FGADI_6197 [Fusarium gaditjirri]|uniref:C6 zinc finger protein n=1 Tax=Fusarium gaditjirri TaxID=282569 RepID=A0A8H4WWQ5_9HYPO|nr:hypothetical protein FGADI_6197 [Fusarium gaditjirri]